MLQVPPYRAAPQSQDEARGVGALRQAHDAQAELRHQRRPGETNLRFRGLRSGRAKRQNSEGLFPRLERRRNRTAQEEVTRKLPAMRYSVTVPDREYFDRNIPCRTACPIHTECGRYVQAIGISQDEEAYLLASAPNPFAYVLGRICAH